LGKSVHLNCPGKKHNLGFGLPLITVSKIKKTRLETSGSDCYHFIEDGFPTSGTSDKTLRFFDFAVSSKTRRGNDNS